MLYSFDHIYLLIRKYIYIKSVYQLVLPFADEIAAPVVESLADCVGSAQYCAHVDHESPEIFISWHHLDQQTSYVVIEMQDAWLISRFIGTAMVGVLIGIEVADDSLMIPSGYQIDMIVIAPEIILSHIGFL